MKEALLSVFQQGHICTNVTLRM